MEGQVRVWDDLEGRALRRQVVKIVEDANQSGRACLHTKDFRSIRLCISVDGNSRMTRSGKSEDAGSADELITKQGHQEIDHGWERNDIDRIRRIRPLNVNMAALILAVVGRSGRQPVQLEFDLFYLLGREQVGNHQIAFNLQVFYPLGGRKGGPVSSCALFDCSVGVTFLAPSFSWTRFCKYELELKMTVLRGSRRHSGGHAILYLFLFSGRLNQLNHLSTLINRPTASFASLL